MLFYAFFLIYFPQVGTLRHGTECNGLLIGGVFLQHVAPTHHGDQPLSAGEHLTAVFSQWRFALAA